MHIACASLRTCGKDIELCKFQLSPQIQNRSLPPPRVVQPGARALFPSINKEIHISVYHTKYQYTYLCSKCHSLAHLFVSQPQFAWSQMHDWSEGVSGVDDDLLAHAIDVGSKGGENCHDFWMIHKGHAYVWLTSRSTF